MNNSTFFSLCECFYTLNPDIVYSQFHTLKAAAIAINPQEFATFADTVIDKYLNSKHKLNEKIALENYTNILNNSANKLIDCQVIENANPPSTSTAITINRQYSEKQWITLLNNTQIPPLLLESIEAINRRKQHVSGVLEYLFNLFHHIDPPFAFRWQLLLIESNDNLDSDIIRDLIASWRNITEPLPKTLINHILAWCNSEIINRLWPFIIKQADHLLQYQALISLPNYSNSPYPLLSSINKLLDNYNERYAIRWLYNALEKLTQQVLFFTELEQSHKENANIAFQRAAYRSIKQLADIFPPLLIISHLIIDEIGGPEKIAMSFMGFSQKQKKNWDKLLHNLAVKTIRRFFLNDLKNGKSPINTIEKLCFNNDNMLRRAHSHLDLKSRQFDSIIQRQKVENLLAANYASLREEKLLTDELSRRFRRFMRMVHEDSLRHILEPQHLQEIQESVLVREYSILASSARKFISIHRNTLIDAEDAFAAKEEFIKTIHQRRRLLIRKLVLNS
ncbi:MAG: hypothetical protein ACRC37_00065 [Lentisphaeria bacterium]